MSFKIPKGNQNPEINRQKNKQQSAKHYTENQLFFTQLKYLFEIFTLVSEKNIKYEHLILASLILVACMQMVVVVLVQYILISISTDFESYCMIVSNFDLLIYFRYTFISTYLQVGITINTWKFWNVEGWKSRAWAARIPLKSGWNQEIWKGRRSTLHQWHPRYYPCYT